MHRKNFCNLHSCDLRNFIQSYNPLNVSKTSNLWHFVFDLYVSFWINFIRSVWNKESRKLFVKKRLCEELYSETQLQILPTAFFLRRQITANWINFCKCFSRTFLEVVYDFHLSFTKLSIHHDLHFFGWPFTSIVFFLIFTVYFFSFSFNWHWFDLSSSNYFVMTIGKKKMTIIVDSSEMCVKVVITFRYNQKRVNT